MRLYEAIYIFRPDLSDEDIDRTIEWLENMIKQGGEVKNIERWGKKRLAYKVNKERYGYYVLIHFDGNADIVNELERNCRHSEDVMKYITIRIKKGEPIKVEMEPEEFREEAPVAKESIETKDEKKVETKDEEKVETKDEEKVETKDEEKVETKDEEKVEEEEEEKEVVGEESDAEIEATQQEEPN